MPRDYLSEWIADHEREREQLPDHDGQAERIREAMRPRHCPRCSAEIEPERYMDYVVWECRCGWDHAQEVE